MKTPEAGCHTHSDMPSTCSVAASCWPHGDQARVLVRVTRLLPTIRPAAVYAHSSESGREPESCTAQRGYIQRQGLHLLLLIESCKVLSLQQGLCQQRSAVHPAPCKTQACSSHWGACVQQTLGLCHLLRTWGGSRRERRKQQPLGLHPRKGRRRKPPG